MAQVEKGDQLAVRPVVRFADALRTGCHIKSESALRIEDMECRWAGGSHNKQMSRVEGSGMLGFGLNNIR